MNIIDRILNTGPRRNSEEPVFQIFLNFHCENFPLSAANNLSTVAALYSLMNSAIVLEMAIGS